MVLIEAKTGIEVQLKSRRGWYSPAMVDGLLRNFRVILERSLHAP